MPHQVVVPVDEGPTRRRENVYGIQDVVSKPPACMSHCGCQLQYIHSHHQNHSHHHRTCPQAQRKWTAAPSSETTPTHIPIYIHTPNKSKSRPRPRSSHSLSTPSPRFPDSPTFCLRGYEGLLYTHTRTIPLATGPASAAGGLESLGPCLRMPSITALLINKSTSRLLQLAIRSTPAPCARSVRIPQI